MSNQEKTAPEKYRGTLVTKDSPFVYREAYNALRTNIDFCFQGEKKKTILVTSSFPEEGKTTLSINLAISLAKTGAKVLLMECDLRKPSMGQKLFHRPYYGKGVTSAIIGECELDDVIFHQDNIPIDIMLSGKIPPNPIEMLGTVKMSKILQLLKERYDYIICDTPPASVLADATVLSKHCDGVLIAVKQNYAHKDDVRKLVNRFKNINANIIGTVMMQYDIKKDPTKKHSDSAYYGYYGYYGE